MTSQELQLAVILEYRQDFDYISIKKRQKPTVHADDIFFVLSMMIKYLVFEIMVLLAFGIIPPGFGRVLPFSPLSIF